MVAAVVAGTPGHDDHVGLGFRVVVERDRQLDPHDPSGRQGRPQGVVDPGDPGGVGGILRLGDDQLAVDELERLAVEHAQRHEPLVLEPRPAARREGDLSGVCRRPRHRGPRYRPATTRSMPTRG
jgi:hypothetical protein